MVLAALGVSFDCASEAEIQAALSLNNVTPDNIIYANPCKPRSHVSAAAALGVHTMTFDNSDELRKMLALNPDARLVIRLLVDDSTSVMPFGTKFGASLSEACALMDECRTLGGNLVGFAFHVGSGCLSPLAYRAALLLARAKRRCVASTAHYSISEVVSRVGRRATIGSNSTPLPPSSRPLSTSCLTSRCG